MSVRKVEAKLIAMLSVMLLAGCSGKNEAPETPFRQGVAFGSSREEVVYRKGEPISVVEFIDGRSMTYPITTLPDGRDIGSFERWVYNEPMVGQITSVDFTQDKVTGVTCRSDYGSSFGCAYRGLSSGYGGDIGAKSSEDDVRQTLGNPDKEEIIDGQKIMSYERLGAYFYLTRGQVDMIQLVGP